MNRGIGIEILCDSKTTTIANCDQNVSVFSVHCVISWLKYNTIRIDSQVKSDNLHKIDKIFLSDVINQEENKMAGMDITMNTLTLGQRGCFPASTIIDNYQKKIKWKLI